MQTTDPAGPLTAATPFPPAHHGHHSPQAVDGWGLRILQRREPGAPPEVAAPQGCAAGASEDKAVVAGLGEAGQVPADDGGDEFGEGDGASSGLALGRPECQAAALQFGEGAFNANGPCVHVDVLA